MNITTERLGAKGRIGLLQAVAANALNMVGIGPFLTIPLILGAMGGPQAMLGWGLGAVIALSDGLVWAELGSAMPGSGGSYQYLREAFGPQRVGRLMSFLFLFQSIVATPLLTASGAVGFAEYAKFLFPAMTRLQGHELAVCICLLATYLLYRNIKSIGAVSMIMFAILLGTMGWIIFVGALHFNPSLAFSFPPGAFHLSNKFLTGLGAAALIAMYDYQGYFTVCLIGDEVEQPARNIPRAILIAIVLLAVCYLSMSFSVIGVVPWQEAIQSKAIVSDFIGRIQGHAAAQLSAVLIMIAAFGSVFTVLLGFTRVPYAAAVEGEFFSVFARVHPKGFPSFSVVSMGIASAACCFFKLEDLISALLIIQILTQFMSQCVCVVLIRKYRQDIHRPFSMYLYPLPVIIALGGWTFILVSSEMRYIIAGLITVLFATVAYLLRARSRQEWPFSRPSHDRKGVPHGPAGLQR
jgi:amino acid transporter